VTSAAGPTVASGILAFASWPWLFGVNLPLGLLTLWLTFRRVPATPRLPYRFDWWGALLCMATFGLLIAGVDGLGHGAPLLLVAAEIALSLALGLFLVRWQARVAMPILAVDLFRRPIFALSVATSVCSFSAASMGLISLPFYFVEVLGRSQVEAGLLMTPWPLFSAMTALIAGRLADRYPVQLLGCLGLGSLCAGLTLLAFLPPQPEFWNIAWRMALCGLGFALFQSPNNRVLMSSAPRERSGAASGVLSSARLLGQTIGAAMTALTFHVVGGGAEGAADAILVGAGAAAAAFVLSALRKSGDPQRAD
jgi:DHA2 family multidrug resistance protein-like MFS transporter